MTELFDDLEERYRKYVASKLGKDRNPCSFLYVNKACKAAQTITEDYDLGIEIATDGLALGYIFSLHGFPTKAVRLSRRGRGAIWQPIDDISKEDINGKRLLLFDNDVVTGRTLRRTTRELGKSSPACMDLLLMHETTLLTVEGYKKWRKSYNIPAIKDSFDFDPLEIRETPKGIEIDYVRDGERWQRTMKLDNRFMLALSTRRNVPKEIRKTMTLQKDFEDDEEALINLERILRSG